MAMLTREQFRTLRNNKESFEAFIQELHAQAYKQGYNQGISDFSEKLTDKVIKGIKKTKGIGEKRFNELIANINEELNANQGGIQNGENSGNPDA